MPKIHYSTPQGTSGEIDLTSEQMTFGRADDNMIVIPDESVSSHHGEITFTGDAWILTDLGSTNGTKVGGDRVEQIQLVPGGSFTLGSVDCIFVDDTSPDAGAGTTAASYTASGYAASPYDGSLRRGFGPKTKEKSGGSGALIGLGVLAIIACGAAAFVVSGMSA